MAQQNFEQPLDSGNLRTQRMTADESRAVIELWQQEQTELTGLTDKPAVPDVAEGLDITVEDVQRLLQDIRARRLEEARALATERELLEIRLAEEERKLAEIQRQRAELHREQVQNEQGQFSPVASLQKKQNTNPVGIILFGLFLMFWLWILFWMIDGAPNGGPFNSGSSAGVCTTTSPNGKPEPCPPGFQDWILNGKK